MTRNERLQQSFDKTMKLMEIGASYNPIIPKADGWQTTIVDHADRPTLIEKYKNDTPDNIEEVDFVWQDGPLIDAIPADLHGTFDGIITSHVGEHMPDLIGFFDAAAKLLKPSGVLVLALPDKRLCFDFYQPLTTTGDLLDARGRTRHTLGTLFDHIAYFAKRGEVTAWAKPEFIGPYVPIELVYQFRTAQEQLEIPAEGPYRDAHVWHFTPASFQLIILELNLLRMIPWAVEQLEPQTGIEFLVWLHRRTIPVGEGVAAQRNGLLQQTVAELKEQAALLEEPEPVVEPEPVPAPESAAPEPVPEPEPALTVSAVIPLYNGERYIQTALRSILTQTVPPIEIIVVNDGSTDRGPELVEQMAAEFPGIVLLNKHNSGQSAARNFGVGHSSGDLIALLDQDDAWYPTHLERLREPFLVPSVATGAELGWVYSDLDEVDEDGQMVCNSFLVTEHRGVHPKRDLFTCLREDMFILPSASLISRKAFDAIGGFDEELSGYEDDDLFLRLFRAGFANVFLSVALSRWRIYPESSSYSYRMRRSRAIYSRKLLQNYRDDPKRARFLHRDLLLPRFYGHALAEYREALGTGDWDRIAETHEELMFWVEQMPQRKKRLMLQLLSMMRSEGMARKAYAMRRLARPLLRRIV